MRRILANHVASSFRLRFARHLLPINFAIGVDAGMDFVTKSARLSVEQYITLEQRLGRAPTRCFILLDLKNMFNEMSREVIVEVIVSEFPKLLPLCVCVCLRSGEEWRSNPQGGP